METAEARKLVTSFIILNITTGIVGGAMQLLVPLYAMDLHAGSAEIGLIRGISGIGMLLLVIPAGFLVDHFGAKRLFITGALAGTLFTATLAVATAPIALVALMGLSGLFSSLKMTSLNASFFRNLQSMGIEKAGWFKGSMSIGLTFIGPLFGGFLARASGFRGSFLVLAALTLVPTALVFIFHNDPTHQAPIGGFVVSMRSQFADFRQMITRRELYLPLLTESVSTGCFATFSTFIVVIAVQGIHLPATTASLFLTLEGGIFILTVFTAGPLITRLSQLQLYVTSVVVTVAGLIGLVLADGLRQLLVTTAVLGLGLGLLNLVTSSRIGRMKGEKGKIVGLFAAAVGAGISLGPMLGGVVGQQFGTRWIFAAFVPLFAGLALAAWHESRSHKEVHDALELQEEA